MISPSTIDQVKGLDIVLVIQKFGTELKKRGTSHWACCPLHGEKTPSFAVSFNKQTFNCFGCHEYGNGIDFVMAVNKLEFIDAVTEIANSFGVHIEHEDSQQAQEALKASAKRRELADITKEAFKFLKSKQPNVAIAGIGAHQKVIDSFHVMTGLSGWAELANHLTKQNIDLAEAAKLKLVTKTKKGNYIDVLRNCIVFPLHDQRGRILGFAKRHISEEDCEKYGKYHNPAESDLYKKRETLYGIYQAMEAMEATGEAYLVEGYTDVTSMHLANHCNTVGSCGTALTIEQARLLRKYCKHVNILRDGDDAGQKAVNRDVDILLAAGLTCSIVFLPENEDPDSFILENMKE